MTYQEIGIYGATRQSWKEDKPRSLLASLYDKNKTAPQHKLLELFKNEVIEDRDYLEPIIETWFTNAIQSLLKGLRKENARQDREARQQAAATARAHITKQIKERMVMLGMVMPNGKAMRYCTGTEMVEFGGWYAKIGKKVGKKMVGQVLNEAEIWKLRG